MKKIFLPLLALVGMVTGFTLTSCGGGGGGGNLSNKTLVLQTGQGYYIEFAEKVQGTGQTYQATMRNDGNQKADLWVTVTRAPEYNEDGKIISMSADVSVTNINYDECEIFYYIVNAVPDTGDDETTETMSLYAPAAFDIKPVEGEEGVIAELTWTLKTMVPVTEERNGQQVVTRYEEGAQVMPVQNVIGAY